MRSIELKREAEQVRKNQEISHENLPHEPYTQHQFVDVWQAYLEHLQVKGEKILASNLGLNRPLIENDIILIEVASDISKEEILSCREDILNFIRKKLQNYSIDLQINVKTEEFKQRYIFTSQDKYDRMLSENPMLEELKRIFELEI